MLRLRLLFYLFLTFTPLEIIVAQVSPVTNVISVDVSTLPQNGTFNYDSTFSLGMAVGMQQTGLYFNWTTLETAPQTYDFSLPDIANIYYPAFSMPIDLTITPIHTNVLEVPTDLSALPLDDPSIVARFNALLDSLSIHLNQLQLSSLVIGSEMDVYLSNDTVLWNQFINFHSQVTAHAKLLWPTVPVACEATFNGLTGYASGFLQQLNQHTDYIGVSYYPIDVAFQATPLTTIGSDFNLITTLYPSKPIQFYQYGFPSSPACGSSELLQQQFISETFTQWDLHASEIRMIDFTWMHDLDTAAVNYFLNYYGINDPGFAGFLGSIGLRRWNGSGSNKPAFDELVCQAKSRGFNNQPANCFQSIAGIEPGFKLIVHPNPFEGAIFLELNQNFGVVNIEIYSALGQSVFRLESTSGQRSFYLNLSDLPSGVYHVLVTGDGHMCGKSVVKINQN